MRPAAALRPPAAPRLAAARRLPAALCLLSSAAAACWTSAAAPLRAADPYAPDPRAPCPTRLVAMIYDRATQAPIAGATVVVSSDKGRLAIELTNALGRFETAAVRPPAKLTIYYGEIAVEHALATCQPPLRLGVDLGR